MPRKSPTQMIAVHDSWHAEMLTEHPSSYGAEIRGQDERAAAHYGVSGLFSTIIKKQVWDEDSAR